MATDRRATTAAGRHLRALLERGAAGGLTDAELLARFVAAARPAGDRDAAETAFAALVERHGGPVLRATRAILGDEAAGLDAFQATFLVLARKAPALRVRDSLAPWLGAVARRVARGARREQARRRRHEQTAAAARPEAAGPPPVDPDRADVAQVLLAEVDRLPEPFRSAVVACHLDGLSQRDAADRLGWPVGTLQSRLDRGRRKLRDRLARRGLAPAVLPALAAPRVPEALALATGRAAASVALTGSALGLATPGALALIPSPWYGGLMAHLKLGSLVATAALALGGSAWTLAPAPAQPGGPGAAPQAAAAPEPARAATSGLPEAFDLAFPVSDPAGPVEPQPSESMTPAVEAPSTYVPPARGPSTPVAVRRSSPTTGEAEPGPPFDLNRVLQQEALPTLLWFAKADEALNRDASASVDALTRLGYPTRKIDPFDRASREKYRPRNEEVFSVVTATGEVLGGTTRESPTPKELADLYNDLAVIHNQGRLMRTRTELEHSLAAGPTPPAATLAPPAAASLPIEEIPLPGSRPDLPPLLSFQADWCGPCRDMAPRLARLAALGYPIRGVDIDKAVDLAKRYNITAVPTFVLVDGSEAEVARTSGSMTARRLADFYNEHRSKASRRMSDDAAVRSEEEPDLIREEERPQPWETALRIKVHLSASEWGFGSGVVIASGPEETLALAAAHTFKNQAGSIEGFLAMTPMPPVAVDRFGGELARSRPATVGCVQRDLPAELVALDPAADVALIRFRPGRVVPAARFDESPLANGTMLTSVGCSHGNDASLWSTKVLDTQVLLNDLEGKKRQPFVKCAHAPKQGRSGGGLFKRDRTLVGLSAFADPKADTGLYAGPAELGRFLRNFVLEGDQVRTPVRFNPTIDPGILIAGHDTPPVGATTPQAADQARRLDALERKLDRLIEKMDNMRGEVRTDLPERPSAIPKR